MQKAKSCDELIQFEKGDPLAERSWPPFHFNAPSPQVLNYFEKAIVKAIDDGLKVNQYAFDNTPQGSGASSPVKEIRPSETVFASVPKNLSSIEAAPAVESDQK